MTPFEDFVGDVEISIIDSVDALDPDDAAKLYAEVLDAEQRLDALRDVLAVLAAGRA
jgi:hypothetical protein